MDVVDQHQMPPRGPHLGIRCQRKCACNDPLTLTPSLAAQRCGRLGPQKQVVVVGYAGQPRQFVDDQRGLVEPTRPESPAMQRHRNEQHRLHIAEHIKLPRHQPRHQPRMAGTPRIFEAKRHRARDGTVSDGSGSALERRSVCETRAAFDKSAGQACRQWDRAARAGRSIEKIERGPARQTKLPVFADDNSAAGATRW